MPTSRISLFESPELIDFLTFAANAPDANHRIWYRYGPQIQYFAVKYTGSHEFARTLQQNILADLHKDVCRLVNPLELRRYLDDITVEYVVDHLRKQTDRRVRMLHPPQPTNTCSVLQEIIDKWVTDLIEKLPEPHKEVYKAIAICNSYEKASRLLHKSKPIVQLYRAEACDKICHSLNMKTFRKKFKNNIIDSATTIAMSDARYTC